jgi:uncharacterized protein with NRDE domain
MCLLVLAWLSHPRYRLVVAGNRDEFHDRPAAPLGWWTDVPGILAGRDQRAGGTWMGVSRSGRFGVVTNFRSVEAATPEGSPSRGQLVPRYLREPDDAAHFLERLGESARQFAGFNLLLGGPAALHYYSNAVDEGPRELLPGIYGLSNHRLDEPWPKLTRTRARFAAALEADDPAPAELLDLLADREPAGRDAPATTGPPLELERALSAPFVRHDRYGTRCSTLVTVEHGGRTVVHERRFDPSGAHCGSSRFEFLQCPAT